MENVDRTTTGAAPLSPEVIPAPLPSPTPEPEKQEVIRDKMGRFVEGYSGNPSGRPKKGQTLTELAQEILEKVPYGKDITYKQALIEQVILMALNGDIAAIRLLWNYIDGMPKEQVEHTGTVGMLTYDDALRLLKGRNIIDGTTVTEPTEGDE